MDPAQNPYAPGAGIAPPALTGRDRIIDAAQVTFERLSKARPTRGVILYGLRGVGKTVLLRELEKKAIAAHLQTNWIEAPEDRSLPSVLAPALRSTLLKLRAAGSSGELLKAAFGALASFISAMKMTYNDVTLTWDAEQALGVADSGTLEADLIDLLLAVGEAARDEHKVVVLFIDELQYVPTDQLGALIVALHQTNQRALPVQLMAAGLPQILANSGKAKSYAERLFKYEQIAELDRDAAAEALRAPALAEGVSYLPEAIDEILKETHCYPYFLQEWGKAAWDVAQASPIGLCDVRAASELATAELDDSFFRVRFDRMTPKEKEYVFAMASLGEGAHRSGDIADQLGKKVESVGPIRSSLIRKGMVFSPAHGDTAFTVPLFHQFVLRVHA